jgi:hypothetical protein
MSLPQQCVADTIEVIEAKENAFNLKKVLLCVGCIDLVINIFNGIVTMNNSYYFIHFLFNIMICLGLIGVNNFNHSLTSCYNCYIIIEIIGKGILILYTPINTFYFVISILGIFVNLYIFKLINDFKKALMRLEPEDIQELKNGWKPIKHIVIV